MKMVKILLLMAVFVSGCEDQINAQNDVVKQSPVPSVEKHKHQKLDEPAICADVSIAECLRIIIPAIWDREIERDCS